MVLVTDPAAIGAALADLDRPLVGVDVERADAARYHRHAALVQVGVEGRCALLDGMSLDDLGELDRFLAGRTAVLHASQNDVVPLAAKGVRPRQLADTATAAAVLGHPTGLGALLARVLDLDLGVDKSAFQRADWEARPLPEAMQAYAAGDVVHLPALWEALEAQLVRAGRLDWYAQELEASVASAHADTRDWTRVRGTGRLDPAKRAVVRRLWEVREQLARTHDIAPNVVLHDDLLPGLANDPPRTAAQLVQRAQRHRAVVRRFAEDLLAAIEDGRAAPPEPARGGGRRWTDTDRDVAEALRRARAEVATDLGIDPGVLCPSRPLEAAVHADPAGPDALVAAAGLRPWQAGLLRDVLWDAYERAVAAAAPGDRD